MSETLGPSQEVLASYPPLTADNAREIIAGNSPFTFKPTLSAPLSKNGVHAQKALITAVGIERAIGNHLSGIAGYRELLRVHDRERSIPVDVLPLVRDAVASNFAFQIDRTPASRAGYSFSLTVPDLVVETNFQHGLYMDVGDQLRTLGLGAKRSALRSITNELGTSFGIVTAIRAGLHSNDVHSFYPGEAAVINDLQRILREGDIYNPDTHQKVLTNLHLGGHAIDVEDPLWAMYPQTKFDVPRVTIHSLAELGVLIMRTEGNRGFDFRLGQRRFAVVDGLAATSIKSVQLKTLAKEPGHLVGEQLEETGDVISNFVYNQ